MITVSIGELVRLVLRSGDIDNRNGGGDRMEEGQRVHQRLQSAYGSGWEKEVHFKRSYDALGLQIQGRADGVFERRRIHEIKSTRRRLADWETEGLEVHWAQACCYGLILAETEGLGEVEVMLTYYNEKTSEQVDFTRVYPLEDLRALVSDLVERYSVWHRLLQQWIEQRTQGLRAMTFPYGEYRPGQRRMAAAVYTAIRDGFPLMAEAPTGVGKTVSTLFPALKAMGEGLVDKVFYLTAKTVARTVAEEASRDLRQAGGVLKTVTLTAKEKICFTGERKCNPVDCTYAKGHYDRINPCLLEALESQDHMDRLQVAAYAEKHHVCPFELSFDLASFSDVIICDYNYVFDPLVRIQRFFGEVQERFAFLVDEGHNLPARAREMFSAQVTRDQLKALRGAFPKRTAPQRELGRLMKTLQESRKALESGDRAYRTSQLPPPLLCSQVRKSFDAAAAYVSETEGFELSREEAEILVGLYRFDVIFSLYGAGHLWVETDQNGGTGRMMCIDPSDLLRSCYQQAVASVVFSATMAPYAYLEEVLGLEGCRRLVLDSPFPTSNRLMLHGAGVDTRLRHREASLGRITDYLSALAAGRQANTLVFFPSYEYLNRIGALLAEQNPEWRLLPQKPGMSEDEKQEYLEAFAAEGSTPVLGLAVLGGSFSEGIDLTGNRLEGVAIVGFGTPYVNMENSLIQQYYDDLGKDGFTYAFIYPAINKVVQAVGRLIRTETDRGVILLMDDRYLAPRYRRLFPRHWNMLRAGSPDEAAECHRTFWMAQDLPDTP